MDKNDRSIFVISRRLDVSKKNNLPFAMEKGKAFHIEKIVGTDIKGNSELVILIAEDNL